MYFSLQGECYVMDKRTFCLQERLRSFVFYFLNHLFTFWINYKAPVILNFTYKPIHNHYNIIDTLS